MDVMIVHLAEFRLNRDLIQYGTEYMMPNMSDYLAEFSKYNADFISLYV